MTEPIYQQVFEPATGQCGIISYQAVDSSGVQLFSNMAAIISGTDFVFNISGNSATYTVQTIPFTFNILGDTTIVGTKAMNLNRGNLKKQSDLTNWQDSEWKQLDQYGSFCVGWTHVME